MEKLLLVGMNVARLNFSHGDFSGHKEVIEDREFWVHHTQFPPQLEN